MSAVSTDVSRRARPQYRAKDIEMAATVDATRRVVLITGAIDTNDHDILVRLSLPSAGRWHVVKAETNLTDRTWVAWQITFGDGTRAVEDATEPTLCRQFDRVFIAADGSRITFFNGVIRPGEAILKAFAVDTDVPQITMSHNRVTRIEEDEEDEGGAGDPWPTEEPTEEPTESEIQAGFPRRPQVETILPVTVVT
jgi:hypothetical protein